MPIPCHAVFREDDTERNEWTDLPQGVVITDGLDDLTQKPISIRRWNRVD